FVLDEPHLGWVERADIFPQALEPARKIRQIVRDEMRERRGPCRRRRGVENDLEQPYPGIVFDGENHSGSTFNAFKTRVSILYAPTSSVSSTVWRSVKCFLTSVKTASGTSMSSVIASP